MSSTITQMSEELVAYLQRSSLREPDVLHRLRLETMPMEMGRMQISPEQGQFMQLLIRLLGAKKTLEVGVFTGYSSLAVALALPADGRIVACDVSVEWTSIARRYWAEASVSHKIDLRLRPAKESLLALIAAGEAETFDFAFIDADKENYDAYYELALKLLRPGGLIGVDNVLWHGRVIDPAATDKDTEAIRALNDKLQRDDRVDVSMLPVGDGLYLARKR